MRYIKTFNEAKDTTKTDERILEFNKNFKILMDVLGLSYDYSPIYRVSKNSHSASSERVGENHSYNVSLNFDSIPYSILDILSFDYQSEYDIVFPFINNELMTEFEFYINVNNHTLSKNLKQMTLEDNLMNTAIGYLIELFSKFNGITAKNTNISNNKIIIYFKNSILSYLNDYNNGIFINEDTINKIIEVINNNPNNFKLMNGIKTKNPILNSYLVAKNNYLKTASDMGEMGF